jgi:hypothetical protein
MQTEIKAMAEQFGVEASALTCLVIFLQDNLSKPGAAEAFAQATPAEQDEIIKKGVKAWRDHSVRIFTDLIANTTEWAQEARKQIADDVWHHARMQGAQA